MLESEIGRQGVLAEQIADAVVKIAYDDDPEVIMTAMIDSMLQVMPRLRKPLQPHETIQLYEKYFPTWS